MMEPIIMALCMFKLYTLGIVSYIFCNLICQERFQFPGPTSQRCMCWDWGVNQLGFGLFVSLRRRVRWGSQTKRLEF